MSISLIAAMDQNRGIGYRNEIPWMGRAKADIRRFQVLTKGHPIIMGRTTQESIGMALPGRKNIVLTRSNLDIPGVTTVSSKAEALEECESAMGAEEIFVIGGEEVYKLFLSDADRLYLTIIGTLFVADKHFPDYRALNWKTIEEIDFPADDKNLFPMKFLTLERIY
jgi:dihydrofolate reductase